MGMHYIPRSYTVTISISFSRIWNDLEYMNQFFGRIKQQYHHPTCQYKSRSYSIKHLSNFQITTSMVSSMWRDSRFEKLLLVELYKSSTPHNIVNNLLKTLVLIWTKQIFKGARHKCSWYILYGVLYVEELITLRIVIYWLPTTNIKSNSRASLTRESKRIWTNW